MGVKGKKCKISNSTKQCVCLNSFFSKNIVNNFGYLYVSVSIQIYHFQLCVRRLKLRGFLFSLLAFHILHINVATIQILHR